MRIETGSWTSDDATVRRQEMFRRVDQDSDGTLTKDELKAGAPDRLRENSAALEELFAHLDANGDGQISLDDLTTALEALRPAAPTYGSDGSRAPAPSIRFSAIA